MKPTRNIVKPNTGLWNAKGKVWFKKNDDGKKISYKEHIKKHTMKENTYNSECEHCNPTSGAYNELRRRYGN
jgi:hypothetical protein